MAEKKKLSYWERRAVEEKAWAVNRAETYLQRNQKQLYKKAADEIEKEIEKLYARFADKQKITLAEARQLIRGADFRKIDWHGMIQESMELREQIRKGKGKLPDEIIDALEEQHKLLEARMAAYTKRGEISALELRKLEIDRKLLSLYDAQQQNIYDYLQSEYDDGYYKQVYNTQQSVGFGTSFVHPNEAAIDKVILNPYSRKNFSKTLYEHCNHFSRDLKENLAVGLIRGEGINKMARRIRDRMGVAYSDAKRLVRTETAYVFEQATKDAYEQCDIEYYAFMATLDRRTSRVCRDLDGQHFKVRDAEPGKNYPPMHPNCRSTTVCWFPGEEEKRAQGTRLAKTAGGKYYEVPQNMTYREWEKQYRYHEYQVISSGGVVESLKQKKQLNDIVRPMGKKVKTALKDIRFSYNSSYGSGYAPGEKTVYLDPDVSKKVVEHEIGHALEDKLFDAAAVRAFKKEIVRGLTAGDIKTVKGTTTDGKTHKIYLIDSPKLIDRYQGRIYADSIRECLDGDGNIDVDRMEEVISVAYQYYMDHPRTMERNFPEMYRLVEDSVT